MKPFRFLLGALGLVAALSTSGAAQRDTTLRIGMFRPNAPAYPSDLWSLSALPVNVKDFNAVGDGTTDDSRAFQNAVNAAQPGAVVYAGASAFNIGSATIVLSKAVTLSLTGASLTGTADPMISITASNVTVLGNGADQTSITNSTQTASVIRIAAGVSGIRISGLQLAGGAMPAAESGNGWTQGNVIFAVGTTGANITNLVVENTRVTMGNNLVYFKYVNGGRIVNNDLVMDHGGLAHIELDASSSVIVANNTLRTTGAGSAWNAIYGLSRATQNGIVGNSNDLSMLHTITGNVATGTFNFEVFNLFGNQYTVTSNTINALNAVNNTCGIIVGTNNTSTVQSGSFNTVTGNTISLSGTGGNGNAGIRAIRTFGSINPNGNTIANNVIFSALTASTGTSGIEGAFQMGSSFQGNTIIFTSTHAAPSYGILLTDVSGTDNRVIGNTVTGTVVNAIVHCYNIQSVKTLILGNTARNCNSDGFFVDVGVTGGAANSSFLYNSTYIPGKRAFSINPTSSSGIRVWGNTGDLGTLANFFNAAVLDFETVTNLTDAATIVIDCNWGTKFTVTLNVAAHSGKAVAGAHAANSRRVSRRWSPGPELPSTTRPKTTPWQTASC